MNNSKLTILALLFIMISVNLKAQTFKGFTLRGSIKGLQDGSVELFDRYGTDPNIKIDHKKVNVINGTFEFRGKIAYPLSVYIRYYYNNPNKLGANQNKLATSEFFLDFGEQYFTGDTNNINTFKHIIAKMQGSGTEKESIDNYQPRFKLINKQIDDWFNIHRSFYYTLLKDSSAVLEDSLQNIRKNLYTAHDSIFYDYTCTHKTSYLVLWELDDLLSYRYSEYYDKAFNLLDTGMQNSAIGKEVAETINNKKKTVEGAIFPEIAVVDTAYDPVEHAFTNTNKNGYLYVDLWFSHCGPCRDQFPLLNAVYEKYKNYKFKMIGVSVIEKKEQDWKKAIHDEKLLWPQYFDKDGLFIHSLNIQTFPTNFLIDGQGKIVATNLEPFQLKEFLDKHLLN